MGPGDPVLQNYMNPLLHVLTRHLNILKPGGQNYVSKFIFRQIIHKIEIKYNIYILGWFLKISAVNCFVTNLSLWLFLAKEKHL